MSLAAPLPQAIVIFGASGDLAKKKIFPALYNLAAQDLLPDRYAIIGFAMSEWDDEAFRSHARASVEEFSRTPIDETVWKTFADNFFFVSGTFDDPSAFGRLGDVLRAADDACAAGGSRLYYLAVPPPAFPTIVAGLASIDQATPASRIVFEKPFGHDLESSRELTATICETFTESQVFRIEFVLSVVLVAAHISASGNHCWVLVCHVAPLHAIP